MMIRCDDDGDDDDDCCWRCDDGDGDGDDAGKLNRTAEKLNRTAPKSKQDQEEPKQDRPKQSAAGDVMAVMVTTMMTKIDENRIVLLNISLTVRGPPLVDRAAAFGSLATNTPS